MEWAGSATVLALGRAWGWAWEMVGVLARVLGWGSAGASGRQASSVRALESGQARRKQGPQSHLLILTSGVHGIEAFTGAAIQIEFLKKYFKPEWLKNLGVLVVHAVNPYGFHFRRRVDEKNVDLNRNMSADEKVFSRRNDGYHNFEGFLNPKKSLKMSLWNDISLFVESIAKLVKHGKGQLAQVAVGGQYQNPKGIYYGGQENQPNAKKVAALFQRLGSNYSKIFHIDLHTGYGARGVLHFFSAKRAAKLKGFSDLFKGYQVAHRLIKLYILI